MSRIDRTIDGHLVAPGVVVWDYDLRLAMVDGIDHTAQDGTVWYRMVDPRTGRQQSSMDASRMWYFKPTMYGGRGQSATAALAAEDTGSGGGTGIW